MRFLLSLIVLSLFCACDPAEEPQLDLSAPDIDIITTVAEATITAHTPIPIEVRINENQSLHDYSIILRNADRSLVETLSSGHLHVTDFTFSDTLLLPAAPMEYTLTVKASDHNDNQSHEQIRWWVE